MLILVLLKCFQNIVNKGEECLLLDNSEHHSWKVCIAIYTNLSVLFHKPCIKSLTQFVIGHAIHTT